MTTMLTTSGYKNLKSLAINDGEIKDLVAFIKKDMRAHGLSSEAIDMVKFEMSKHTLTITDEERKGGAFHGHADGEPFYALMISGPSIMFCAPESGVKLADMTAEQQACAFVFDIGMNILRYLDIAVMEAFKLNEKAQTINVSSSPFEGRYEVCTRYAPELALVGLATAVRLRLGALYPKPQGPSVNPPSPEWN